MRNIASTYYEGRLQVSTHEVVHRGRLPHSGLKWSQCSHLSRMQSWLGNFLSLCPELSDLNTLKYDVEFERTESRRENFIKMWLCQLKSVIFWRNIQTKAPHCRLRHPETMNIGRKLISLRVYTEAKAIIKNSQQYSRNSAVEVFIRNTALQWCEFI